MSTPPPPHWGQHGPPATPGGPPPGQPGPAGPAPGHGPAGPWAHSSYPAGPPGAQAPWQGQPATGLRPDGVRRVVQILCPVLVLAGLTIPESGSMAWQDHLLWSLFAFAAALTQLATLSTRPAGQTWPLAGVATAALVGYWVIIVLPGIASNAAFVLTLGVGCAVVGAWLAPGRRV